MELSLASLNDFDTLDRILTTPPVLPVETIRIGTLAGAFIWPAEILIRAPSRQAVIRLADIKYLSG